MNCWFEIDAKALMHNYQIFCHLLGKENVAPVLKANAYGHGLEEVFGILKKAKPAWICVSYLDEAATLRKAGFKGRILIVTPVPKGAFKRALKLNAEILLGDFSTLQSWAKERVRPLGHVKLDTGLSRQGFVETDWEKVCDKLLNFRKDVAGICTHFANVEDVLEHEFANLQMARFQKAKNLFKKASFKVLLHAASSASALILPESRFDISRVGISLYGYWPSPSTRLSFHKLRKNLPEFKPVLSWYSQVSLVKKIAAGSFVGYGCSFRAVTPMKIAVLPIGYYEGYARIIGNNKSYVLIDGKRCSLVGRISMNIIVVDVTHVNNVREGTKATLLGSDGDEVIDAHHLASWSETIHYELLARLNPLIPRKVI